MEIRVSVDSDFLESWFWLKCTSIITSVCFCFFFFKWRVFEQCVYLFIFVHVAGTFWLTNGDTFISGDVFGKGGRIFGALILLDKASKDIKGLCLFNSGYITMP